MKMKCKHDMGWCIIEECYLLIFPNHKVAFNFQGRDRKTYRIKVQCNYVDCDAVRNVYITASVVKWGKIKKKANK